MDIKHVDDGKHGAFVMLDSETQAGEMVYTWAGDAVLIIDHTEVDDNYRGQGVGRHLLDALVAYVRENEIKVIPLCPFAKAMFERDETIRDVLRD